MRHPVIGSLASQRPGWSPQNRVGEGWANNRSRYASTQPVRLLQAKFLREHRPSSSQHVTGNSTAAPLLRTHTSLLLTYCIDVMIDHRDPDGKMVWLVYDAPANDVPLISIEAFHSRCVSRCNVWPRYARLQRQAMTTTVGHCQIGISSA